MPIYTYRCPQGHEWDEVRGIEGSETSEATCPECTRATSGPDGLQSGQALPEHGKRVPANFNAAFKGSGWTPKFYPGRKGK